MTTDRINLKPRRRWYQFSLRLLSGVVGLPVFETFFLFLVGTGMILALLFPLIQCVRQVVR